MKWHCNNCGTNLDEKCDCGLIYDYSEGNPPEITKTNEELFLEERGWIFAHWDRNSDEALYRNSNDLILTLDEIIEYENK